MIVLTNRCYDNKREKNAHIHCKLAAQWTVSKRGCRREKETEGL